LGLRGFTDSEDEDDDEEDDGTVADVDSLQVEAEGQ
jgi:hypothetical protein